MHDGKLILLNIVVHIIYTCYLLSCLGEILFQMHSDDFRTDRHGVVSGLRDGGYSDDMTLAAIAGNASESLTNTSS